MGRVLRTHVALLLKVSVFRIGQAQQLFEDVFIVLAEHGGRAPDSVWRIGHLPHHTGIGVLPGGGLLQLFEVSPSHHLGVFIEFPLVVDCACGDSLGLEQIP